MFFTLFPHPYPVLLLLWRNFFSNCLLVYMWQQQQIVKENNININSDNNNSNINRGDDNMKTYRWRMYPELEWEILSRRMQIPYNIPSSWSIWWENRHLCDFILCFREWVNECMCFDSPLPPFPIQFICPEHSPGICVCVWERSDGFFSASSSILYDIQKRLASRGLRCKDDMLTTNTE